MNWNDASTSCADAREAIADALITRRAAPSDPGLERHLTTCAECRAYRTECESTWAALGELPVPAPSPDARARFDAAVQPAPRRAPWRAFALAASLVIAALLGFGAARERSAAPDSTPQYLLLLYDTRESNQHVSTPAQLHAVVAEYTAWARTLASTGNLVSAEKLSDAPPEWLGGNVTNTASESIGGFFLIRARSADEARRIAEGCPHLKYGGRIELRPIQTT